MRVEELSNSSMNQYSSHEEWNYVAELLRGDAMLMDGTPAPAVENQFEDYLAGIQLYVNFAEFETRDAFEGMQIAYENYLANRSIGNSQIIEAIEEFQQEPINLTDTDFKIATAALIEMMHSKVAKAYETLRQEASSFMNLLTQFAAQTPGAPKLFVEQFLSANTSLMKAYNAYMTGIPTDQQIFALEAQLDSLKITLG